jgi:regulator of sirC expression with transglutaminase-like and TPR domain
MDSRPARQLGEILAPEGAAVDLAEAALLVAREEYPDLDVLAYVSHLEGLATRLRLRLAGRSAAADVVPAMNAVLFDEEGFRGNVDDYYDPRNSFLNEVLDRRLGIPITLSAVYMEVGRRAGAEIDGLGFPGHFIVRVKGPSDEILVDPFAGGARLTVADCQERLDRVHAGRVRLEDSMLRAWHGREILARMLRNLKGIYLRAGDHVRALRTLDLLLAVLEGDPAAAAEELRDRGLLYESLGCYAWAARDLEAHLTHVRGTAEARSLGRRIEELRRKAAHVN